MPTIRTPRLDRGLIVLAAALIVGAVAVLLDSTIVSVALDAIARDLGASEAAVPWISTAYLLSLALVTPLVGWAADRFGARSMWMFALTVFLVGSVLCAAAWSVETLIAFRALKGIGGGMVLPLCQAILARAAGPERFGRVMSLVSLPGLLAPVMGPVLGGTLADTLGWRWIFLVNVPICLFALVLAWRYLPRTEPGRDPSLDLVGALLLPPGLAALICGFSRLHSPQSLTEPLTVTLLLTGAALVAAFCVHALRTSDPLLDLRLFAIRSFAASCLLTFLQGLAVYGSLLLLPLFYARVRGYDAGAIGWLLAPQGLGTMLGVLLAGTLADRYGSRRLVLSGTAVSMLGTLVFTQLDRDPGDLLLGSALFVRGLGLGALGVAIVTGAYRDIGAESIARATGTISVVQRLGASFGTAVTAVILAAQLTGTSAASAPAHTAGAYANTFWWVLAFMLATLVPAVMLPRARPAEAPGPVPAEPQESAR